MGFLDDAEVQTIAALRLLIARVTEPALGELEALRVALDLRCEAVTAALAGTERIDPASLHEIIDRLAQAAGQEAHAAARAARRQALEEARVREELERAEAERRLEAVQAEAAAQRERDRLEHRVALTGAVEEARSQVDAIRAQAEAQVEAARATQTQLLGEAYAQFEAAQVEAELAVAGRLGEIEDLRTQLEAARSDVQRANAETARVEQAAQVRQETARAEFETQKDIEGAGRAGALEEARTEVDAERTSAQTQIEAAHAVQAEALARPRKAVPAETSVASTEQPAGLPGGAHPPDDIPDQLSTTVRTLDAAANITQALDALVDGFGAVFPRAALFVVKSQSRLQGWRSVGFTGAAAITNQFELSLAADSALTQAVKAGRVIVTGNGPAPDEKPTPGADGPWSVTLPVAIGDRVVAVVHAEGGERMGNLAPSFDRGTALKVSDMLVRHAGRRLAALTASARMAFDEFIREAPPTTPEAIDASAKRARQEAPPPVEDVREYARLLAFEIKRYNEANVLAGFPDRNLHERLKGEIERCRSQYARRVPPEVGATSNCFDEALFEILGGGDVDFRGPFEQTTAGETPTSAALNRPAGA